MFKINSLTNPSLLKKIGKFIFVLFCLYVVYSLFVNNNMIKGAYGLTNYLPSEQAKSVEFSKYNDFQVTLEEEVVSQMAPIVKYDDAPNMNYTPILDGLHDAAPLDYDGVN
jgi:hypothetical protein